MPLAQQLSVFVPIHWSGYRLRGAGSGGTPIKISSGSLWRRRAARRLLRPGLNILAGAVNTTAMVPFRRLLATVPFLILFLPRPAPCQDPPGAPVAGVAT